MKTTTKYTLAALTALASLASTTFANDKIGETAKYNIISVQPGNGQAVAVYVPKVTTTIAIDVHGSSIGSSSVSSLALRTRDNGHGESLSQYIPGGIN